MIKKIKQFLAVFALGFTLLTPLATVGTVGAEADIRENLCGGVKVVDGSTSCQSGAASTEGVTNVASQIVNFFSWIVGIISVIMIIVGGFKYITSGGASDKVTSAKNTIIYAVIGLIIVALAQFIVNFVIGKAIGVDASA